MKDFTLSFSSLKECKLKLNQLFTDNPQGKCRLSVVKWTNKRSLSSNAQMHLWYGQIAKAQGDKSALDVKNFCKDAIGLPILLNNPEHGDKIEFLLHKLDYYKHSYESRMKLIQCLEVTSLFNTKESKEYMENMCFYWNENGVNINFKD